MMKFVLGGLAAVAAISSANASTYVNMGPGALGGSTTQVTAGNNPQAPTSDDMVINAASSFDIYGIFDVSDPTTAISASTVLEGTGGLSGLTAAIYHFDPTTDVKGAMVAAMSSATADGGLASSAAWVFQSPTSFALTPGYYALEVTGNKSANAVLQYELSVTSVPLPGAALMFGAGLLVVGGLAARRKQVSSQAI